MPSLPRQGEPAATLSLQCLSESVGEKTASPGAVPLSAVCTPFVPSQAVLQGIALHS